MCLSDCLRSDPEAVEILGPGQLRWTVRRARRDCDMGTVDTVTTVAPVACHVCIPSRDLSYDSVATFLSPPLSAKTISCNRTVRSRIRC